MPDTIPTTQTADEQIKDLLEKKAARIKALRDEEKQNTLDVLKLEAEQDGLVGFDCAIVDLSVRDAKTGEYVGRFGPPILLVRNESSILHRKFTNGKITEVATYDYVKAHVQSPTIDEFRRIADERPSVVTRCADRLIELYGFAAEDRAGKS